jgi:hypothetical protein
LFCIDLLLGKDLETNNGTTAIAMQWRGKHTSVTTDLLLKMGFSTQSVERAFKGRQLGQPSFTRMEAGSNTPTVTLQVIGSDKKGSLKSETVKYGRKSQRTWIRETLL